MMEESASDADRIDALRTKLNSLSDEISQGIVSLNSERRDEVQNELNDLRENANKEIAPEASYTILLYRKYSDIMNRLKEDSSKRNQFSLVTELEEYVFDNEEETVLAGWDAVKSNKFRLRALTAVFSLICFAVMSSVPYISHQDFNPNHHFPVSILFDMQVTNTVPVEAYVRLTVSLHIEGIVRIQGQVRG
jgi:hypothetical protein